MALSDNQKIAIVGIGALLLWHFFSGKKDEVATEQNVTDNLSADYKLIMARMHGLETEFTATTQKVEADRTRFKRREFDSIVERSLALKAKQKAEKIYARIEQIKGEGVFGYKGESEGAFEERIGKLIAQCREFIDTSVAKHAEVQRATAMVIEDVPIDQSVWTAAPGPGASLVRQMSRHEMMEPRPEPRESVVIAGYDRRGDAPRVHNQYKLDHRLMDTAPVTKPVKPNDLKPAPKRWHETEVSTESMDVADAANMEASKLELIGVNSLSRDTTPAQPTNSSKDDDSYQHLLYLAISELR